MGAWSTSITGNDAAQDLRSEYQAAFSYYDKETALRKIDEYVRRAYCTPEDEGEWCDYFYSLADFMWKKGILTDAVRDEAIRMIDSGFGLDIWAEAGAKTLASRNKVLAAFREKLLSPQCAPKKIRVNLYLNPIYGPGQQVAIQLQTAKKTFLPNESLFDEDTFRAADGKWIVLRYLRDHISYRSCIVPEVADHWAQFQLYARLFDHCPTQAELSGVPFASLRDSEFSSRASSSDYFTCESSMFYFKKRQAAVIGTDMNGLDLPEVMNEAYVNFSINMSHYNPDTTLLNAILRPRR